MRLSGPLMRSRLVDATKTAGSPYSSTNAAASLSTEFEFDAEAARDFKNWCRNCEGMFETDFFQFGDAWKARLLLRKLGKVEHDRFTNFILNKIPCDLGLIDAVKIRAKVFSEKPFNPEYTGDISIEDDDQAQTVLFTIGMRLAFTKCALMLYNIRPPNMSTAIQGAILETAQRFTHLGSCDGSDGSVRRSQCTTSKSPDPGRRRAPLLRYIMTEVLHVEAQGPLRHCWGSGNRILVHSVSSGVRSVSDSEDILYEVKWGVSLTSNEFMRRLVKTSYDVFCALQYNTNPERCASFSVQYRAALTVCSQEILQFLKLSVDMDDAKASYLMAQCELVLRLELIWHLAELIFLQSFPEGHLAYNLCNWFHVQSQEAADNARLLIDLHGGSSGGRPSLVRPEEDERFWPTVLALVLQARPHEAASLLAIHSYANSRGLRSLRQLLVAMPIASHNTKNKGTWRNSGVAFSQAWNYWQSECRRRLSGGEFDHTGNDPESTQYVKLIVSILAGSSASWDNPLILLVTGGSHAWYFRFVSFLFYTDQLVTMDALSGHLDAWLNGRGISEGESDSDLDQVVDSLLISIFKFDVQSFVRVACEKLESWWLVAHFTNLLHRTYPDVLCSTGSSEGIDTFRAKPEDHAEVSSVQNQQSEFAVISRDRRSPSLPDFFLIGYAESLACDLGLLPVALGYLDFCENGSFRQSALLLRHACPVSTRAVNWFLSQARSRSLHETSKQLAGIATRRFLPLVLHNFDKASGNGDKIVYNCLPSCATIGWALMARNLGIVARIAEYTLARDKGFCVESPSEDPCPHPTEIAEMAAIVLGFCNDQALRSVPPSQSFQPATSLSELCLSSELAFLVRYAKLQQCFASGDIETAVDRLIDLLITGSGSSSAVELGAASCGSGSLISTRLRLRLLTEVRHLLGRRCIRRDQAELLISALVDLRLATCEDPTEDNKKLNDLLVHIHILLAQELTSSLLVRESQINNVVLGGVV